MVTMQSLLKQDFPIKISGAAHRNICRNDTISTFCRCNIKLMSCYALCSHEILIKVLLGIVLLHPSLNIIATKISPISIIKTTLFALENRVFELLQNTCDFAQWTVSCSLQNQIMVMLGYVLHIK